MTRPKLARDGTSCFVPRTWRSPPHRRLDRKPPSEAVTSTTAHPDLRATSKALDHTRLNGGHEQELSTRHRRALLHTIGSHQEDAHVPDPAMLHRGFRTVIQCLTSIL